MAKKPSAHTAQPVNQTAPTNQLKPHSEINPKDLQFVRSENAFPIWVDIARVSFRLDLPIATLIFYSTLPEEQKNIEVARLQMSCNHLKNIADMLCKNLNYYPEKPDDLDEQS